MIKNYLQSLKCSNSNDDTAKKIPKFDIYINHKNFEHFTTTKILNQ